MTLSQIPNLRVKKILWGTLFVLLVLLVMTVVAYIAIEFIEFDSNKKILRLTLY